MPEDTGGMPASPELQNQSSRAHDTVQRKLFAANSLRQRLGVLQIKLSKLWSSRHKRFRRYFVGGFFAAILVALGIWLWLHWSDPDRDFRLTNFVAAFYPFPLSVFIAFLPDMERSERLRPVWRSGIVVLGAVYSLILWHQQSVNLAASRQDQNTVVATAVNNANAHTDQQISDVKKDMNGLSGKVEKINDNLQKSADHSDKQIADLRGAVSESLSKTEASLNKSISGIAIPSEKKAELVFSLWTESATLKTPVLSLPLSPDSAGVFEVPFTVGNPTANAVRNADVWIDICDGCIFAEEPEGFQKTTGTAERTRTRTVNINPGTNLPKMILKVKLSQPFSGFDIALRYSCDICGNLLDRPRQIARVEVKQ